MRQRIGVLVVALVVLLLSMGQQAQATGDNCPRDSVRVGNTCMDKFENSLWYIPAPLTTAERRVIQKIRAGTVTAADLAAVGATQVGFTGADLDNAGCFFHGNGCLDVYAVSIPGVTPSRFTSWFQAAATARNSRKRLPTNQEWQAAAFGTPNGAPCVVSASGPGPTGTAGCVSDVGTFDMVGNVFEWVAEWVPRSPSCSSWSFNDDDMCLEGASTGAGPGALIRGGSFGSGAGAGVFAVYGIFTPQDQTTGGSFGFRSARTTD